MHFITLDSETDFEGWRKAARTLVLNNVNPSDGGTCPMPP
jgi:hypothetical protein